MFINEEQVYPKTLKLDTVNCPKCGFILVPLSNNLVCRGCNATYGVERTELPADGAITMGDVVIDLGECP